MEQKISIGTAGLGLMGSSIVTCLLAAGHPVTALTNRMEEAEAARERITGYLAQLREEGILEEQIPAVLEKLFITDDIGALRDHQVVVESIIENPEEKKKLYRQLEEVLDPAALIGSNTSAIPISYLQEGLLYPGRLFGLHWAEPAHITRFMEIICGQKSDPGLAEEMMALARGWGKEPSLLKRDIRGFITNRIMYAMLREAFFLVENGYATVADVDRSLRNDLGYWITFAGPFRFMDLTGIPAYLTVMQDLFPELSNSTEVPPTISRLVADGAKGVANAKGFYPYTEATAKKWEELFVEFSYAIRKLAAQYPQNTGDQ